MAHLRWLSLALVLGSAAASAQTAPAAPFLRIDGRVQMDWLLVRQAGTVSVRLHGTRPVREDQRVNLPPRIESGQTYRRVDYRFRLAVSPLLRGRLTADSLLFPRPAPAPDFPSPR